MASKRLALRMMRPQFGMNVCLFTDSLEPSGLGEHMLTLAAELIPHYRILFVCPPTERGQRLLAKAKAMGCSVMALDIDDAERGYARLERRLRRLAICVFHCHAGIGWEGQRGVKTARNAGVPVVLRTEHLPYLLTDEKQQRDYHRHAALVDHFICVSEEAYRSYVAAGLKPTQVSVVRNGIRPVKAKADRAQVLADLGLPPDARLVLTVARMTPQKGHKHLLEAIPTVAAHEPQASFVWVGDGPLEPELRAEAERLGLQPPQLCLAGWRNDVPSLLAAADVFVLPSLFEGLPLVMLEAMAAGKAVVGTTVCGTREAIEDEVSGRLVEPGNPAALATAILEALTPSATVARWREMARRRYEQLFSAERMGRETRAIYEATFAQQRWPAAVLAPMSAPTAPLGVEFRQSMRLSQAAD